MTSTSLTSKSLTLKSLAWAVAVTLLALTGATADEEPGAITNYKKAVSDAIIAWDANMDRHQFTLHSAAEDWHQARGALARANRTREDLERDRQKLESDRKALEKKLEELQKDLPKQSGKAVDINKIKEEIKRKTDEINGKTAEIKKVDEFKKKVEDALPGLKQKVADLEADIAPLKVVIENIAVIPSPASDAKALEKDTYGQYRVEWGPELQRWIQAQINAKTQKWTAAPVAVTIDWPQAKFERKAGPSVIATIKMPTLEARPSGDPMRMRP